MALLAALLLLPVAVAATEAPPEPAELELTPRVRSELARLQESWLDWLSAVYQEDPAGTGLALAEMQSGAARMGLRRLPDLSLGAAARAVGAAESGAPEQARLALRRRKDSIPGWPSPSSPGRWWHVPGGSAASRRWWRCGTWSARRCSPG
ncbi:MAG: hypothetical protein ACE5EG_03050 [Thermoanaerobaculia bacterium]